MSKTATAVTMKGNPVTLLGKEVEVGQKAPEATLVALDLSEKKLSSYFGKKIILSVVPSLDTPVCDLQTKRFNQEAAQLNDTIVLTISIDLPFAQKRWCGANDSKNIQTLSDYRYNEFGQNYGLIIQGPKLLTRAILIIDAKGIIQYKQIVAEVTTEPNYNDALNALKKI